ncbi:hypothetical protein ACLOJK_027678 [Asimina triloba]
MIDPPKPLPHRYNESQPFDCRLFPLGSIRQRLRLAPALAALRCSCFRRPKSRRMAMARLLFPHCFNLPDDALHSFSDIRELSSQTIESLFTDGCSFGNIPR